MEQLLPHKTKSLTLTEQSLTELLQYTISATIVDDSLIVADFYTYVKIESVEEVASWQPQSNQTEKRRLTDFFLVVSRPLYFGLALRCERCCLFWVIWTLHGYSSFHTSGGLFPSALPLPSATACIQCTTNLAQLQMSTELKDKQWQKWAHQCCVLTSRLQPRLPTSYKCDYCPLLFMLFRCWKYSHWRSLQVLANQSKLLRFMWSTVSINDYTKNRLITKQTILHIYLEKLV